MAADTEALGDRFKPTKSRLDRPRARHGSWDGLTGWFLAWIEAHPEHATGKIKNWYLALKAMLCAGPFPVGAETAGTAENLSVTLDHFCRSRVQLRQSEPSLGSSRSGRLALATVEHP